MVWWCLSFAQHEWHCRLFKVKYLLVELSKTERTLKNRRVLEILCAAVSYCAESDKSATTHSTSSSAFKSYFLGRLRRHLVELHAASLLTKHPEDRETHSGFLQNVQYVQKCFPSQYDSAFQVWMHVDCLSPLQSTCPKRLTYCSCVILLFSCG